MGLALGIVIVDLRSVGIANAIAIVVIASKNKSTNRNQSSTLLPFTKTNLALLLTPGHSR